MEMLSRLAWLFLMNSLRSICWRATYKKFSHEQKNISKSIRFKIVLLIFVLRKKKVVFKLNTI